MKSNEARCTSCHAGYGWVDDNFDFDNPENIDCLVCHDQTGLYKKFPTDAGHPVYENKEWEGKSWEPLDLASLARAAGMLRSKGVETGDRVIVYMPMIPEAAIAMLACARIGAAHSVVLTALSGGSVDLSIGGVAVNHTLAALSDMWFGEYVLLWRPPNGSSAALGPGSVGPGVAWLRRSLAAIDARYATSASGSDVFDADLADKVRLFQRDHRLDVDGLAGHQTQIIINTLLEPDRAPRLTTPRLAQE